MNTKATIIGLIIAVAMAISLQVITNTPQTDQVSANHYPSIKLGLEPGAYNDMFNGDK